MRNSTLTLVSPVQTLEHKREGDYGSLTGKSSCEHSLGTKAIILMTKILFFYLILCKAHGILLPFSVKGMLPTTFAVLQLQHHETPTPPLTKPSVCLQGQGQGQALSKPLRLAMKASHTPPLVQAERK